MPHLYESANASLEEFRLEMNRINNLSNPSELDKFKLYFLIRVCDLAALIKQQCTITERWEEVYLVGQIYIVINESIKKIIGFAPKESKSNFCGNPNSLWIKIKPFIEPQFQTEYNGITNALVAFVKADNLQNFIKSERSLSVHSCTNEDELDAIKLFRYLANRNTQLAFNILIAYFMLLNKISVFLSKVTNDKQ